MTRKALDIARSHEKRCPGAPIDLEFVAEAAMLHDIGIKFCDAPAIGCTGSEPYIRHGILGKALLEAEGLPRHALVCSRHTGSGITRDEVLQWSLPLPPEDHCPVTLEEKIICVADKFHGKSPPKLWEEKGLEKISRSIAKYGPGASSRWETLRREILGPG